jgi:hypothetical protein
VHPVTSRSWTWSPKHQTGASVRTVSAGWTTLTGSVCSSPSARARVSAGAGWRGQVVLEGLQRMKARGAHTALVCFEGDNEPARRLYESVGFGVRSTIDTYTKGA